MSCNSSTNVLVCTVLSLMVLAAAGPARAARYVVDVPLTLTEPVASEGLNTFTWTAQFTATSQFLSDTVSDDACSAMSGSVIARLHLQATPSTWGDIEVTAVELVGGRVEFANASCSGVLFEGVLDVPVTLDLVNLAGTPGTLPDHSLVAYDGFPASEHELLLAEGRMELCTVGVEHIHDLGISPDCMAGAPLDLGSVQAFQESWDGRQATYGIGLWLPLQADSSLSGSGNANGMMYGYEALLTGNGRMAAAGTLMIPEPATVGILLCGGPIFVARARRARPLDDEKTRPA